MEATVPRPKQTSRKQQMSRLRSHAPLTIQVGAPSVDGSEWRVVIPLLSPLDTEAVPWIPDEAAGATDHQMTEQPTAADADGLTEEWKVENKEQKQKPDEDLRCPGWKHPAAPFFHEPTPGNVPVFLLPDHCS